MTLVVGPGNSVVVAHGNSRAVAATPNTKAVLAAGVQGPPGPGLNVLGYYDTYELLAEAHPTGSLGDAYVSASLVYYWDGNSWVTSPYLHVPVLGIAGVLTFPAGEALGGHRMVALQSGELFYADHSNLAYAASVVGMTMGAVAQGETAEVMHSGRLSEPSWSFTPDAPLFLSANGLVSHTAPTAGFVLEVGTAVSATEIIVQIGKAFIKGN